MKEWEIYFNQQWIDTIFGAESTMQGKALFQVRQTWAAMWQLWAMWHFGEKAYFWSSLTFDLISLVQGLSEIHPTETPVADMKARADRAIKDTDYGGEGWAQMVSRPNKGFPEIVKQFLKEQFLKGEESASAKVSCYQILVDCRSLCWQSPPGKF